MKVHVMLEKTDGMLITGTSNLQVKRSCALRKVHCATQEALP